MRNFIATNKEPRVIPDTVYVAQQQQSFQHGSRTQKQRKSSKYLQLPISILNTVRLFVWELKTIN